MTEHSSFSKVLEKINIRISFLKIYLKWTVIFEKGKMLIATGQEKTMDWEARKNKQGCVCE